MPHKSRSSPSNDFTDALRLSGLSQAEAATFLDRSLGTIQAYSVGKRDAPAEIVLRLQHLWEDAIYGGHVDRYGNEFPESSLAIRRATRMQTATSPFMAAALEGRSRFQSLEELRETLAAAPASIEAPVTDDVVVIHAG